MNARAIRPQRSDPRRDTHGPAILCGVCRQVIGWDRPGAAQPVVVIPDGLVMDGGEYHWSQNARPRDGKTARRATNRAGKAPGYTTKEWNTVGPVGFARLPCVLPCPAGHKNDVDTT